MAKIVYITEKSLRPNNAVYDIVDVVDDNVELSGNGYACFGVVDVPNLFASDIITAIALSDDIVSKYKGTVAGLKHNDVVQLCSPIVSREEKLEIINGVIDKRCLLQR